MLSEDFQRIDNILADGIFAAYLLGYDSSREEPLALIEKNKLASFIHKNTERYVSFADGDGEVRPEKAGSLEMSFDVPPKEAIDYFSRKRIVTKKEFDKLSNEAKAGAFYVSGVYKKDVLTAFHKEITNALESGQSQKQTIKNFKNILDGAGHRELGDFHLETVFRSNMNLSYQTARRKQMEETADLLPFWEYSAVNDSRTRPTHRALDGLIYPANHEFWDTHYPPWGFNCRCTVIATLDYPADYNHAQPNPDTTIVYDGDGLPAKAEYLNQVVDLKATKFVGVPKQGIGLQETIETAAKEARKNKVDPDDLLREIKKEHLRDLQKLSAGKYQTPQQVLDSATEFQRRKSKVELLHIFDSKGQFVAEIAGDAKSVGVPDELKPKLNGGTEIHWHPPGGKRFFESFSIEDVTLAAEDNSGQTFVVTENYLYAMRPPRGKWAIALLEEILARYESMENQIERKLIKHIRAGELTVEQAEDEARHLIWKRLAKKTGLRYNRIRI